MSIEEKDVGEELKNSLVSAIVESLDGLNLESILQRSFSPLLNDKKVAKINNAFIPKFKSEIKKELDHVFSKVGLSQRLSELERIKENYRGRAESWRPPTNVDDYCRSTRIQAMLKKKAELDFLLKKKQNHIDQLKEKVEKSLSVVPPSYDALEKKKKSIIDQCNDNALNIQKLSTYTGTNVKKIACTVNDDQLFN